MTLNDLLALPGRVDVTTDSRSVRPGWIFVAVRGSNFDGHSVVEAAVANGAIALVVERAPDVAMSVPVVVVPDARHAYAQLVQEICSYPARGMRVYGVTGTNGKTTCATLLEQMFRADQHRVGFIGTTGNRYGGVTHTTNYTTPHAHALADLFVDMRDHGVSTVCMEVSSHALDQHRVWGVDFRGAVFTNLTRDHLDYHKTLENYARAKKRLFDMLPVDASAVFNADSEWTPYMKRNCVAERAVTVGMGPDAEVRIVDVELGLHGATFALVRQRSDLAMLPARVELTTKLLGGFNVMNAALCAVLCMLDGMPSERVVALIANVTGPAGRMERYPLRTGAVGVVDYAHTPDALENALIVLRDLARSKHARIHVVFGCGGDRDRGKRPEMGRIAAELADSVIVTSDNPRSEQPADIIRHIVGGIEGPAIDRVSIIEDRRTAIRSALASASAGDIVLVAGKGHEEYQIIGTDRLPFSDTAEIQSWDASAGTA